MLFAVNNAGGDTRDYTSFNVSDNGASLLYDTLGKMGVPVSRSYSLINTGVSTNGVYVFICPDYDYLTDQAFDNALEWVYKGGRLIFLEPPAYAGADFRLSRRGIVPDSDLSGYTLYTYGMGKIITGDADPLLNKALMENSAPGAEFASMLGRWFVTDLYFDEGAHGYLDSGNAWRRTPEILKLLAYQLGIIAILVIWHLGKRFGNPVPYYEESEREENEHIKALANIYDKAGATEAAFANYSLRFTQRCSRAFHVSVPYARDNLRAIWRGASLPHSDALEEIISAGGRHLNVRQLKRQIKNIQTCEMALRLKGDSYAGRFYTASDTPRAGRDIQGSR